MQDNSGDIVTDQWLSSHRINIPRATGIHQSTSAWVRVDNKGTIVAAGVADQRVIAWLVHKQILNSSDVDYAIAYVTCRDAHRRCRKERGYKSALDLQLAGSSVSCEQGAEIFSLMRRQLGAKYTEIIEYAWDTHFRPNTPENYRPPYRKAFNALPKAFHDAVKAIQGSAGQIPLAQSIEA